MTETFLGIERVEKRILSYYRRVELIGWTLGGRTTAAKLSSLADVKTPAVHESAGYWELAGSALANRGSKPWRYSEVAIRSSVGELGLVLNWSTWGSEVF